MQPKITDLSVVTTTKEAKTVPEEWRPKVENALLRIENVALQIRLLNSELNRLVQERDAVAKAAIEAVGLPWGEYNIDLKTWELVRGVGDTSARSVGEG